MLSVSNYCIRSTSLKNVFPLRIISVCSTRTFNETKKPSDNFKYLSKNNIQVPFKQNPHRYMTDIRKSSTFPTDFEVAKTQLLNSVKEIKLSDTKNAPQPIFWTGIAGLIPIVLPPVSFLILGYSYSLATLQMTFAATISAFLSGTQFGTMVAHEKSAQWPNILVSILPQFVSFTALLLPQVIGFPLIFASIAANGFIDLTSTLYPSWYKALRLGLSIPVLFSVFLTCIFKMFN